MFQQTHIKDFQPLKINQFIKKNNNNNNYVNIRKMEKAFWNSTDPTLRWSKGVERDKSGAKIKQNDLRARYPAAVKNLGLEKKGEHRECFFW